MRRLLLLAPLTLAAPAQSPAPLAAFDFLLGTWSATTTGGAANAHVLGTYTFRRDLDGHILTRTSWLDHCTAPQAFACQHHDLLTIFPDSADPHSASLHALYLDSEGHAIRYLVTAPDATTILFQSESAPGVPHYRLTYHLTGSGPAATLTGKFEGTAPGSDAYHPYLEWSGPKQ